MTVVVRLAVARVLDVTCRHRLATLERTMVSMNYAWLKKSVPGYCRGWVEDRNGWMSLGRVVWCWWRRGDVEERRRKMYRCTTINYKWTKTFVLGFYSLAFRCIDFNYMISNKKWIKYYSWHCSIWHLNYYFYFLLFVESIFTLMCILTGLKTTISMFSAITMYVTLKRRQHYVKEF